MLRESSLAGARGNVEEMHTLVGGSDFNINREEKNISRTYGNALCSPNNSQMASIAETIGSNEGSESRKIIDFLPLRSNDPGTDTAQTKTPSMECNEVVIPNPNAIIRDVASGGLEIALSSQVCEEQRCKMKIDASTSASPLETPDDTAENNLHLPRVNSVQKEASPTHSKTRFCSRKGKEKVFLDGDVCERTSKYEVESHESVESCSSVELFSKGKKRWGDEQEMIVESKRARKQIDQRPASTAVVGQDSSFMNWISNMVKGLNKPDQEECPTLALTLSHPNHAHTSDDREIVTVNRNHDTGSRNMGFQTIFQSLYCSNSKEQETRISNGYPTGGSKELVLVGETRGVGITPIACHSNKDNFGSQLFKSNEKFNESAYGNEAGPSAKPKPSSAIFVTTPRICETNSSSKYIARGKVENGRSSFSSSHEIEHNTKSCENKSNTPSEAKVVKNVGYGSESLWITRFSAKTPGPLMNLFHSRENSSGELERSTDGTRPILRSHDSVDFPIKENSLEDQVNGLDKELEIRRNGDQKSVYKLNPILPSTNHKSSEAMASVFARRLDALKHIKPSDIKDNVNHATTTCFYCGRNGHDLHDCTETVETEWENFTGKLSSFDKAEVSPCLNSKWNEQISSDKRITSSSEAQKLVASSSFGDNVLKEKQITSLDNLVGQRFSYVPKGMFDSIKNLRLTRTDILKWMNCTTSFSHLDGFFLRLRLGKWEGGLLGTGYHVACITGEQREIPSQGRKNSVAVSIGSVRCSVESQYISNQDFLEGELMAWWCSTLRTGGKIPSEDYLKMKLEERKRLGF
ncbi:zinc knuckle (CCHC-type) family protein [Actinidia rufa]|uniref:Zinc knuckle (CCHC-type) family protein n=1 Tax=Actinidia rufa TaxID=165716 RepID=A0A7J0GDA1_9ERIC|nr:zinc knuckle (CCHC-type) family protein [Actinidia rufa]